ncbi:MAG: hypothetical protein HC849_04040 [Oscillatoriales cyanobacterium RU_3_3]|nr:hypothetical protein [Oscillatoriales cyanobacterium RU_3_3]
MSILASSRATAGFDKCAGAAGISGTIALSRRSRRQRTSAAPTMTAGKGNLYFQV